MLEGFGSAGFGGFRGGFVVLGFDLFGFVFVRVFRGGGVGVYRVRHVVEGCPSSLLCG